MASARLPFDLAQRISSFRNMISDFSKPQLTSKSSKINVTSPEPGHAGESEAASAGSKKVFLEQTLDKLLDSTKSLLELLISHGPASPEAGEKFNEIEAHINTLKEMPLNEENETEEDSNINVNEIIATLETGLNSLIKSINEIEEMSVPLLKSQLEPLTEQGIKFLLIDKLIKETDTANTDHHQKAMAHLEIFREFNDKSIVIGKDYMSRIPGDHHVSNMSALVDTWDKLTEYMEALADGGAPGIAHCHKIVHLMDKLIQQVDIMNKYPGQKALGYLSVATALNKISDGLGGSYMLQIHADTHINYLNVLTMNLDKVIEYVHNLSPDAIDILINEPQFLDVIKKLNSQITRFKPEPLKKATEYLKFIREFDKTSINLRDFYIFHIPLELHVSNLEALADEPYEIREYIDFMPPEIIADSRIAELKNMFAKDTEEVIEEPVNQETDVTENMNDQEYQPDNIEPEAPAVNQDTEPETQETSVETDTKEMVKKETFPEQFKDFAAEMLKIGLNANEVNFIIDKITSEREVEFNEFWPKVAQGKLTPNHTKVIFHVWLENILNTEDAEHIIANKEISKLKTLNNCLNAHNNGKLLVKYGIITLEYLKESINGVIGRSEESVAIAELNATLIKNLNSLQNFFTDATNTLKPLCQNIIKVQPVLEKELIDKIFQAAKLSRDIAKAEETLTTILITKLGFNEYEANDIFDAVSDNNIELRALCQAIIITDPPLTQKQLKKIFSTIETTHDVSKGKTLMRIIVELKSSGLNEYDATEIFRGIVPIIANLEDSGFRNLLTGKITELKIDRDQLFYNNLLDKLIPILQSNIMLQGIESKLADINDKDQFFSLMNIVISLAQSVGMAIITDEEAVEILNRITPDENTETLFNNINLAVSEKIIDYQDEDRITEKEKQAKSIFYQPYSNDAKSLNNAISALDVGKNLLTMGIITENDFRKSLRSVIGDVAQSYVLILYYKGLLWAQRSVINVDKDELKALCRNINNLQPRLSDEQTDNVINTAITEGFFNAGIIMSITSTLKKTGLNDTEINTILSNFIPVLKSVVLAEAVKNRLTNLTKNQAIAFMSMAVDLNKLLPLKILSAEDAGNILATVMPDAGTQEVYKNIERAVNAHIIDNKDVKNILKNPYTSNNVVPPFNTVVLTVLPMAEELLDKGLLTRIDFEASLKSSIEHMAQGNYLADLYRILNEAFDSTENLRKKGLVNAAYLKPFLIELKDKDKLNEFTVLAKVVENKSLPKQQTRKIFETVIEAKDINKGKIIVDMISALKAYELTDNDITEIIETITPNILDKLNSLANNLIQAKITKEDVKKMLKDPYSDEARLYF